MKAIVASQYGGPEKLQLKEVPRPVPKEHDVIVKVFASSVNTQNLLFVTGKPNFVRMMGIGLTRPAFPVQGNDMAGRVESVGAGVTQWKPGDDVMGDLSVCRYGAYAEYVAVPESILVSKPTSVSFQEAAGAVEAASVALCGLRDKAKIQKRDRVLIYGASGGIGTFAVQLAKYFGADVTGVCSTRNADLVRSLGADRVIDYTQVDYAKIEGRYDCIFSIPYRPIAEHLRALSPSGIYVSTGDPSVRRIYQDMLLGPVLSKIKGKKIAGGWSLVPNRIDLAVVAELLGAGKIRTVIDKEFPLENTADALRFYSAGRTRGKVIITMPQMPRA